MSPSMQGRGNHQPTMQRYKRLGQETTKTNKYTTSQEQETEAHQCRDEKTMQKTMHVQATPRSKEVPFS